MHWRHRWKALAAGHYVATSTLVEIADVQVMAALSKIGGTSRFTHTRVLYGRLEDRCTARQVRTFVGVWDLKDFQHVCK